MIIVKDIWALINAISRRIKMSRYDNYSIAEYFRSQGAEIGEDCYFGIKELANEPYLVSIGNHVQISDNVKLLTHNVGWCFRDNIPDLQVLGRIRINDNCYIGANSIILPNVKIGPNAIIGAGSVVTRDIPENTVAAGNPAVIISPIEIYKQKAINIWSEQKPKDYLPELKPGCRYTSKYIHQLMHLPKNRLMLKDHLVKYLP